MVSKNPKSFETSITTESLDLIAELLEETVNTTKDINPQTQISLVMGATGEGKSTFISYLLGAPLEFDEDGLKLVIQGDDSKYAKIGKSSAKSETLHPQLFDLPVLKRTFMCDCPGFGDSRGFERRASIALGISNLVKSVEQISAVCLVISYQAMNQSRGEAFKGVADILNDASNDKRKLAESLILVITKPPLPRFTSKAVVKMLDEFLGAENEKIEDAKRLKKSADEINKIEERKDTLILMKKCPILVAHVTDEGQTKKDFFTMIEKFPRIPSNSFTFEITEEVSQLTKSVSDKCVVLQTKIMSFLAHVEKIEELKKQKLIVEDELKSIYQGTSKGDVNYDEQLLKKECDLAAIREQEKSLSVNIGVLKSDGTTQTLEHKTFSFEKPGFLEFSTPREFYKTTVAASDYWVEKQISNDVDWLAENISPGFYSVTCRSHYWTSGASGKIVIKAERKDLDSTKHEISLNQAELKRVLQKGRDLVVEMERIKLQKKNDIDSKTFLIKQIASDITTCESKREEKRAELKTLLDLPLFRIMTLLDNGKIISKTSFNLLYFRENLGKLASYLDVEKILRILKSS